jgi:hypothetical protein
MDATDPQFRKADASFGLKNSAQTDPGTNEIGIHFLRQDGVL